LDRQCDMNGIAFPSTGCSSPTVGNHSWSLMHLIFNLFCDPRTGKQALVHPYYLLHPEVHYWKKNGKYSKRPCHPPIVLASLFGRITWCPFGLHCEFFF
jgi:hypothetical protein